MGKKEQEMRAEWITAIATVIYMFFTGRLILETRKSRRLKESPQLDIFTRRGEGSGRMVYLVIKNNGYGGAYNIRLEADKDFVISENNPEYTLRNIGYFKNGIVFLPANSERENFFTFMGTEYKKKISTKIKINAKYTDKRGKKKKDTFIIDLSEFEDTSVPPEPSIYKISKDVEKIQKNFYSITSGFKQLKVLVQTSKGRIIENKKNGQ